MLKIIKKVQKLNHELNMRIGIHTGDIIGGVMGTNIVRYDIYGIDVLFANSMESNGIPGKIIVSESTKNFLEKGIPKKFQFNFHTQVKILERTYKAFELVLGEGL
jgi:class 3 adenylate cyclase